MEFFEKIKGKFTGGNDNPYGDGGYDPYPDDTDGAEQDPYAPQSPYGQPEDSGLGISTMGGAIELKVVKPDKFEDVTQIADHLKASRTVVLNLENTNKEAARRIIDFLTGVAYTIDGRIKKVANNAFVITPATVNVSDGQIRQKTAPVQPEPEVTVDNMYEE